MGKKKDAGKQSLGATKAISKAEKKAEKRSLRLFKKNEKKNIEEIVGELQAGCSQVQETVEEQTSPPSPRSCMSLVAHPTRDQLVVFGGEFFNGSRTTLFNDLFIYDIKTNVWMKIVAADAPSPRCSHQMVAVARGGGQLWLFGGEFSSSSQSQFYHYQDLWVFHLEAKKWEKVPFKTGPAARSGHRMVHCKNQLILFGGFQDNMKNFRYFNDLWSFNLDIKKWTHLTVVGDLPSPRSACCLVSSQDQVFVYGGYRQERLTKDTNRGIALTDMFILSSDETMNEEGVSPTWKSSEVEQSGDRPRARSSCTMVGTPANRALLFGGVQDEEVDDEDLNGTFFSDLHSVQLDSGVWHSLNLSGKNAVKGGKQRLKREVGGCAEEDMEEMEMEVDSLQLSRAEQVFSGAEQVFSGAEQVFSGAEQTFSGAEQGRSCDDKISGIDINDSVNQSGQISGIVAEGATTSLQTAGTSGDNFWPCPRMNTCLAIKDGVLFIYGGTYEDKDKQITLSDMHSLDLFKLNKWNTIISHDKDKQEWLSSESSSDEEESGDEGMELEEAPEPRAGENPATFFGRTRDYWMDAADEAAECEGLDLNIKQLKKNALKMAEDYLKKHRR